MNARIKKKLGKRNGFRKWNSYREDLVVWYHYNHDTTPRQPIESTKHLLG